MQIQKEFLKFLEQNSAKDNFEREVRRQQSRWIDLENYLKDTEPNSIITLAFDWNASVEGFDYWHNLSIRWTNKLSSISNGWLAPVR